MPGHRIRLNRVYVCRKNLLKIFKKLNIFLSTKKVDDLDSVLAMHVFHHPLAAYDADTYAWNVRKPMYFRHVLVFFWWLFPLRRRDLEIFEIQNSRRTNVHSVTFFSGKRKKDRWRNQKSTYFRICLARHRKTACSPSNGRIRSWEWDHSNQRPKLRVIRP